MVPQNVSLLFNFWHSLPILGKEAEKGSYKLSSAEHDCLHLLTPSFIQHLWGCFVCTCMHSLSLPLFLHISDMGTATLSAPLCPQPISTVLRKGRGELHRTPLGTSGPTFFPGLNSTSITGSRGTRAACHHNLQSRDVHHHFKNTSVIFCYGVVRD